MPLILWKRPVLQTRALDISQQVILTLSVVCWSESDTDKFPILVLLYCLIDLAEYHFA